MKGSTDHPAGALTRRAWQALREAALADDPDERFRIAHLAALRTAGALIAERGRPGSRRRLQSAWLLVESLAPELAEWARYFAAGARARAAIEAGARAVVTARAADDQLRSAEQFLRLVEEGRRYSNSRRSDDSRPQDAMSVEESLGRFAVPLAS